MTSPILYEVNTRCWLRELSEKEGRTITLSEVPDCEIERWRQLGFTHIWLMGVWQVGDGPRAIALKHWREKWRQEVPSAEEDVHGSPYALREYAVDSRLGEPISLLLLKERLAKAGMRLILDFVPNHLGLDSTEPLRYPARFVQASSPVPGTFECKTKFGKRHFAHGRDPYFPPWSDTIQIDYRVRETQEAMAAVAQMVSMFGHGLRCDMAMLPLPEIFEETWRQFPAAAPHEAGRNFWRRAIPAIRQLQPHVELIAEVYWDREAQLQEAGFDFTYNKKMTDFIARGQFGELSTFLRQCSPQYLRRSVHFLENHDEPRAAEALPLELHKAAALLILGLPGMAMLHDGQLEGRRKFAPIQLSKRAPEPVDPEIAGFYEKLLAMLQRTAVRRGRAEMLVPIGGEAIGIGWRAKHGEMDVVIVNLKNEPEWVEIPMPGEMRAGPEVLFASSRESLAMKSQDGRLTTEMPSQSAAIIRICLS